MASPSFLPPPGSFCGLRSTISNVSLDIEPEVGDFDAQKQHNKKRRICSNDDDVSFEVLREIVSLLPVLCSTGCFMEPSLNYLVARELVDPGYCSRVPDFTVWRLGYGCVKFLGMTDIRWLDIDKIVKFHRHEIVVYEDDNDKPEVGQGLNKPAEVTLKLRVRLHGLNELQLENVVEKLREKTERQGADFVSFDRATGEWKFLVSHFSRFGLSDDDEEDITMDDLVADDEPVEMNGGETPEVNEENQIDIDPTGPMLYHSLPAHLGLDPIKMKEMRMLMFPDDEEDEEFRNVNGPSQHKLSSGKEHRMYPLHNSAQKKSHKPDTPVIRKTPLALLDYRPNALDSSSPNTILMTQQNKCLPLKTIKGFNLDLERETPVTGSYSHNIVDAGLFMGRSFRVGWGPNGILVHSGAPVGSTGYQRLLSSVINVEKVAIDRVVRDENNRTNKDLVKFAFDCPMKLHETINHEIKEVEVGSFKLRLQNIVFNRIILSDICRSYIDIIEKQLEVPELPSFTRLVLMHQVMVWELIKVLFSEREMSGQSKSLGADNEEDMMQDIKDGSLDIDQESLPLLRRAEFSCWLQESVCHRVQEEVGSLSDSSYLEHIFLLLTGRQLDGAVEIAVSRGDVRLACLLSQAGGSMVNRADVARQLDIWRINGLDFNFIEKERVRLYELLSGNIHNALNGIKIDWKRFLGLLMWYHLAPDASLPITFQTYQHLLDDGKAPYPLPMYIDEGPADESVNFSRRHFDLSYYLMLLHAKGNKEFSFLKTMFSAFSSTDDPLDYHMIWHQRAVLEAVGVLTYSDLQILDMALVSQLLCVGQCHWAIYVVLHMPYQDAYPYLQAKVIQEILLQYCESWSSDESQRQFIENLDIPRAWLHDALAVYYSYHGNLLKALEHYLECANWQKAHSIFVTSVAHTLFLSANHSEIWRITTAMEDHKSEIENWDLGAGIYLSFYLIRSSFREDGNTMRELDSLESKNSACRDFLSHLKESLDVYSDRLAIEGRVAYSKMAEEISELLLSNIGEGSTRDDQLSCFDTVFGAPVPEDLRSNHLQDAVSLFTCYLSEMAA